MIFNRPDNMSGLFAFKDNNFRPQSAVLPAFRRRPAVIRDAAPRNRGIYYVLPRPPDHTPYFAKTASRLPAVLFLGSAAWSGAAAQT